jgi:hypothetical protein
MNLITVEHTNGSASSSLLLDTSQFLSNVRSTLESKGVMRKDDLFLKGNSGIIVSDEPHIPLLKIINDDTIFIGRAKSSGITEDLTKEVDWRTLNDSQKFDLLEKCQLSRGIILEAKEGFKTSFKDIFAWKSLPAYSAPRVTVLETSSYSFFKITRELNLASSNKNSLSLGAPFVSAEAEYKHSKEKITGSSKVVSYMVQKHVVSKASFNLNPNELIVDNAFVLEVDRIFKRKDSEKDTLCNLLHALNEWGMYIPVEVTLGGALYSFEKTEISDFSQAEKESKEFSASVKASYSGVSGGGGHGQSSSSSSSTSTSTKYVNIQINQIGGRPSSAKNEESLKDSLCNAMSWQIVDIEKFYPSLMLLNNYNVPGVEPQMLVKCVQLLNKVDNYITVTSGIQPFIDIKKYVNSIEALLCPW